MFAGSSIWLLTLKLEAYAAFKSYLEDLTRVLGNHNYNMTHVVHDTSAG